MPAYKTAKYSRRFSVPRSGATANLNEDPLIELRRLESLYKEVEAKANTTLNLSPAGYDARRSKNPIPRQRLEQSVDSSYLDDAKRLMVVACMDIGSVLDLSLMYRENVYTAIGVEEAIRRAMAIKKQEPEKELEKEPEQEPEIIQVTSVSVKPTPPSILKRVFSKCSIL